MSSLCAPSPRPTHPLLRYGPPPREPRQTASARLRRAFMTCGAEIRLYCHTGRLTVFFLIFIEMLCTANQIFGDDQLEITNFLCCGMKT